MVTQRRPSRCHRAGRRSRWKVDQRIPQDRSLTPRYCPLPRMVGRDAASAMASASAMSFFWRFTNGFTYAGGIRGRSCPRSLIARPRYGHSRMPPSPRRRGLLAHELQQLRTRQPASEYNGPVDPGTMGLKYVLGQIQADNANIVHGRTPRSSVATPATLAHSMPPGGGVHPIAYGLPNALVRIRRPRF
jgi:hypothetical protein